MCPAIALEAHRPTLPNLKHRPAVLAPHTAPNRRT